MRVVASHLHMRRVTIDTARDAVIDAARAVKAGTAGPETENLVARLEKVTGVGIAELRGRRRKFVHRDKWTLCCINPGLRPEKAETTMSKR
jgi:hypothetical protein